MNLLSKGTAHGFRNLSVIKINWAYEWALTKLKTKID